MELKTEDDLFELPNSDERHELVAGFIVAEPLPSPLHDQVRQRLFLRIHEFVAARKLGKVFFATGFKLSVSPDTVRGPDFAFVRGERLSGHNLLRFIPGAPDLAVEVLSPTNRRGEILIKVAEYLHANGRLVWVIDPRRRLATTYRSLDPPRLIAADGALEGEDVLPGFSVPLASLFSDL
ncbi:MAG TPA: Uma2 family endonuclease [Candidatus Polarisedimenticolaceae bacterium]|nr:Uma2 family endonuclease [Candidatus Polarisedimenticolaceae bacterium]